MNEAAQVAGTLTLLMMGGCCVCDSACDNTPPNRSPYNASWRGPARDYMHRRAYFEPDGTLYEEEAYQIMERGEELKEQYERELTESYTRQRIERTAEECLEIILESARFKRTDTINEEGRTYAVYGMPGTLEEEIYVETSQIHWVNDMLNKTGAEQGESQILRELIHALGSRYGEGNHITSEDAYSWQDDFPEYSQRIINAYAASPRPTRHQ